MTEQESHEGVNRRHLFQTLAAGAAVSGVIGSPALAQQPPAAALAVASAEDYALNPTRWGSAEVAALFPGFQHLDIRTSGAVIRLRHGGSGPPLLLLHGRSGRNLPRTSNTVREWTVATTWPRTFQTSCMINSQSSLSRDVWRRTEKRVKR